VPHGLRCDGERAGGNVPVIVSYDSGRSAKKTTWVVVGTVRQGGKKNERKKFKTGKSGAGDTGTGMVQQDEQRLVPAADSLLSPCREERTGMPEGLLTPGCGACPCSTGAPWLHRIFRPGRTPGNSRNSSNRDPVARD